MRAVLQHYKRHTGLTLVSSELFMYPTDHTVWHQNFEEHNFRGFRGLAVNRENYAPRNNAKFSKTRIRCRNFR